MNNFLSDLDVRYIDGHRWLIMAPFVYHLGTPDGPEFVRVDVGEITDFASIPRPLKMIWPSPGGKWDKPAVIHDELYVLPFVRHVNGSARRIERNEADSIFNEAMGVTQVNRVSRWMIHKGVRIGGSGAWDRYRQAEQQKVAA